MNRIKLLVVILFIAALGTGFLVGVALSNKVAGNSSGVGPRPATTRPSLTEALSLTSAQSDQLKAIWSDWDPSRQGRSDRHAQCQKDRDDSVQALLTDSQKTAFDEIQKKYRQQLDQLDEERHQAFQAAIDKTRAILSDTQRAKYDEILKNAPPGRGPRGGEPRGGDRNRGPASRHMPASSQPSAMQQF